MSSRGTSGKHKGDEKVHVAIRCRPMSDGERKNRTRTVVETNMREREIRVTCNNNQDKTYKFDKTFGPSSKQVDVYKSVVEPHIDEVLSGYNCTVLAYGQTGTGKTYTMEGERSGEEFSWENDPKAGIIPRTLSQLFDRLEKESVEFSVHVSLLEIYNELIYDLLSPTPEPALRKIYDDSSRKGSVKIADQTEIRVLDKSEVYDILEQGAAKRTTAATLMNDFSSRSHSVFTITVHIKEQNRNMNVEEELVKIGKLNLVDLAGSENIGRSGAVDMRAREAGNINQSLLTLGRCITALVDHAPHVPYRESRLTRILQDSLGGTTKTSIIATISPGFDNLEETLSTLDYAFRAKNIQNKPKVNQRMTKRMLIKQYDSEIEQLRRELIATREKNGVCMDQKQYDAMTSRLEELEATLQERQQELDKYKELFGSLTEEFRVKSEEYAILQQEFQETHQEMIEKTHLAEVKGEHGAQAVEDGIAVVNVTDEVTESISKVHDKVDRFKAKDQKEHDYAKNYQTSFTSDVDALNAETKEMLENNKQHLNSCIKELDIRSRLNKKQTNEMKEMMTEFKATIEHSYTDCKNILGTVINNTQSKLKEQDEFMTANEEMMSVALTKFQDSCTSRMMEMHEKIQHILKSVSDVDSAMKQKMINHHENMSTHAENVIKKMEKLDCETENFKNQQEAGLNSAIETIKKQLDLLSNHGTSVQTMSEEVKTDLCEFPLNAAEVRDEMKKESEKLVSRIQSTSNEIEKGFGLAMKESLNCVESGNTVLSDCTTKTENVSLNVMEDLRDTEEKTQAILEDASETATVFITSSDEILQKGLAQSEKQLSHMKEELKTTSEKQDDVYTKLESVNEKLKTMTEDFCSNKISILQPTGETPARKEYTYPKNFEYLPNDDEILSSFREKMRLEEEEEERRQQEEADRKEQEEQESASTSGDSALDTLSEASMDENEKPQCGGGMPFFMAGKNKPKPKQKSMLQKPTQRTKLPMRTQNY